MGSTMLLVPRAAGVVPPGLGRAQKTAGSHDPVRALHLMSVDKSCVQRGELLFNRVTPRTATRTPADCWVLMGCGRSGMSGRFMTGWCQEGRSRPDGLRRSIGLRGRRRRCRLATLGCWRRGVAASRRGIGSCCIAVLHLRCQLGSVRRTSSCSRPELRLDPGDLAQLPTGELGDRGVRAWAATAVGQAGCLGQQRRGWRGPQFHRHDRQPLLRLASVCLTIRCGDPAALNGRSTSGSHDRPPRSLSAARRDRHATRPRPPRATLPPNADGEEPRSRPSGCTPTRRHRPSRRWPSRRSPDRPT
jgi:hypothetical protein